MALTAQMSLAVIPINSCSAGGECEARVHRRTGTKGSEPRRRVPVVPSAKLLVTRHVQLIERVLGERHGGRLFCPRGAGRAKQATGRPHFHARDIMPRSCHLPRRIDQVINLPPCSGSRESNRRRSSKARI